MNYPRSQLGQLLNPPKKPQVAIRNSANLAGRYADIDPAAVAGAIEFVQIGENDDVALHALELEDGGGRRVPTSSGLGVAWKGLETTELGDAGVGLLPCPAQAQDDDGLG